MKLFSTPSIQQLPAADSHVFAFQISGEISDDDMEAMAEFMNGVFDTADGVNMLMIFENYEGSDAGALFDADVIKSRFRALSEVKKYAVVGAPEKASKMVDFFGSILPVDAKAFDAAETAQAWAFVGSAPASASQKVA